MKAIRTFTVILVFVLLLSIWIPQSVFAAETEPQDYSSLFQQVKTAGDNLTEVSPALSEAFHSNPVEFINALAQEDMSMRDKVGDAIVAYNTGKGNDLEFLRFVLEVFASDGFVHPGRDAYLSILMGFHPDVTGADDEFIAALFRAKRFSDGISSDKLGIYIYELFQDDPVRLLHLIMEEDEAFQQDMVSTIDYQSWYNDVEYREILSSLSTNVELSETEQAFIAELIEKLNSKTPANETEAPTEPVLQTDATEATEPATTNPTVAEPINPQPDKNRNILPIAVIAIVLVGFGIIAIKNKKKSQNNA